LATIEKITDDSVVVPNQPKSRYSLVVLASKRARQLKDGAPPLVEPTSPNLLTTALQEIAAGKIGIIEAVEEPDDEAPRYVRGGFIASEYEDILNETDSNLTDLSLEDDLDVQDLNDNPGIATTASITDQATEE
jgi:DNA-directed RNA polymerase subunit omega